MGARIPLNEIPRFAHRAMGCEFGISIPGEDEGYARTAATAAFAVLDSIEEELSLHRPTSDIARINAAAPGRWTPVGLETTRCLGQARRAWRMTGGAFDPAFARGGFRQVILDARRHRVKTRISVTLDLGAIGKGYALDRMRGVLIEWKIGSAFLQGGGSSAVVLGTPPESGGWRIGLRNPARPSALLATARLRAGALSGSGIALNGPHIVDPRTGRPATRPAAWSWASTGALSDALSTAFMVMPVSAIRAACARAGGAGIIATGGRGRWRLARFGVGRGVMIERETGGRQR